MQRDTSIERLMFCTNDRQPDIRAEVLARQIGQPQGQVRQSRKSPGLVGIGDETGGIDDNLATIQPWMEDFAQRLRGTRLAPLGRQYANSDRTIEFGMNIDA